MTSPGTRAAQTQTTPRVAAPSNACGPPTADSACLALSSKGLTTLEHISRFHVEMISAQRLTFVHDQEVDGPGATLLRWSMVEPSGSTVGRGVDVVFRDGAGLIRDFHMFMGVN